jgi:hypothetical protein
MKTTEYILYKIDRLPRGYVFTYNNFCANVKKKEAIIKALNRMVASGKIAKLSKGKFYKQEITPFGELQPSQKQVVKDLLEKDGKTIGYLTGLSIYNELGLSTQVSNVIQIGRSNYSPELKRGKYIVRFVRQKNMITQDNIKHLQLLDTLRFIKTIPDSGLEHVLSRCKTLIIDSDSEHVRSMVRLAKKYPPSTRALLGSILDDLGLADIAEPLRASLNPVTTYRLFNVTELLPTTKDWNFV